MYYYYHPESDSLWCQNKKDTNSDGHQIEISKEEAEKLAKDLNLKEIPKLN